MGFSVKEITFKQKYLLYLTEPELAGPWFSFKLKGKRINITERIKDIKKRYSKKTKFSESNPSLVKAIEKGLSRIIETCEKVEKLRDGKLNEGEISRYGFL